MAQSMGQSIKNLGDAMVATFRGQSLDAPEKGVDWTPIAPVKPRGLRWRIFYRTAQKVGSHQKTWDEARRADAVAIVWQFNDGPINRELGTPYYVHLDDWIARCWDPTLYLRQQNKVKFGRWAKDSIFRQCWTQAIEQVTRKPVGTEHGALSGTAVVDTHVGDVKDQPFKWMAWYDNGQVYTGHSTNDWEELPTDGIMCVYYHHILNGILIAMAIRRYTYYYWKNGELINTDDLDVCVQEFPAFKKGCPEFTGASYLDYGLAIQEAMTDTLEDIP